MESMAYIYHDAFMPGSQLTVNGPLRLQQAAPVLHTGTNQLYSVRLLAP